MDHWCRHDVSQENIDIFIGWDTATDTYFIQAGRNLDDGNRPDLWLGSRREEFLTLDRILATYEHLRDRSWPSLKLDDSLRAHLIEMLPRRVVICDICNRDYSDSPTSGGYFTGSWAICPVCAQKESHRPRKHKGDIICPPGISFADFIRSFD
jgi:hypothetical protein